MSYLLVQQSVLWRQRAKTHLNTKLFNGSTTYMPKDNRITFSVDDFNHESNHIITGVNTGIPCGTIRVQPS